MRGSRRGQQFIEYLLLFAIVVIVVVTFARSSQFKRAIEDSINMTLNVINKEAQAITP
ncbi:MAG: hypothetical protein Q8Q08_07930 [Candidatus Omnitrophota bacterium]|nr:hypothetical protein [Candidatus Omnitrophota bacterium]MDZ4243102.1 hypothetical protein [Candidatus Omnitrophota bacterium]